MAAAVALQLAPAPLQIDEQQQLPMSRLTLDQLLKPESWDLPEWNGPQ